MAENKAPKKHGSDAVVKRGDLTKRVAVEQLRKRGVNVEQLIEMLIDAAVTTGELIDVAAWAAHWIATPADAVA